jgi:hypothetical protein
MHAEQAAWAGDYMYVKGSPVNDPLSTPERLTTPWSRPIRMCLQDADKQLIQGMIDNGWLGWDDDLGMYCTRPGPPPPGFARHLYGRLREDKSGRSRVQLLPQVLMDPKM